MTTDERAPYILQARDEAEAFQVAKKTAQARDAMPEAAAAIATDAALAASSPTQGPSPWAVTLPPAVAAVTATAATAATIPQGGEGGNPEGGKPGLSSPRGRAAHAARAAQEEGHPATPLERGIVSVAGIAAVEAAIAHATTLVKTAAATKAAAAVAAAGAAAAAADSSPAPGAAAPARESWLR